MSSAAKGGPLRSKLYPPRLALAATALVSIALIVVYVERGPIAADLARRWLAERRVPAGLQIQSLSLTGFSAKVRLGPADHPDLTVERLDVRYAMSWPGPGKPLAVKTQSIRFWRPRLAARLENGRLDFGDLAPLLRELARAPAGAGPPPDIAVDEGTLALSTPAGPLLLEGGGAAPRGVISIADARWAPFALSFPGLELRSAGGVLHVRRSGQRMTAAIEGRALSASGAAGDLRADEMSADADLPAPTPAGRFSGAMRVTSAASGLSIRGSSAAMGKGRLSASFAGALDATADSQSLRGGLQADLGGLGVTLGGTSLRQGEARLSLPQLTLSNTRVGLAAGAQGAATLVATDASAGPLAVRVTSAQARIDGAQFRASSGAGPSLAMRGSLAGRSGLTPAAARRLAQMLPVLSSEPGYRQALERMFVDFRLGAPAWTASMSGAGAHLALTSPLTLESASGARLMLTRGQANVGRNGAQGSASASLVGGGLPALNLTLARWSATPSVLQADLNLAGQLDALFVRGATLGLRGHASVAASRFRFDLAGCAPVSARSLDFAPNPVNDFNGSLCPAGGPLVAVDPIGWRASGRIEQARGLAPSFAARVADARGTFSAAGSAAGLASVGLTLDQGRIFDATQPVRFEPLSAAGRLDLAHGAWRGDFAVATVKGHNLGRLRLQHDVATATGRADIDARGLAFTPAGLQPAEMTPLASFAKNAAGAANFTGWLAWRPGAPQSSGGELALRDLGFKSPAGTVQGMSSDIRLTSLAPLVSAPGQEIAVREVDGVEQLRDLSATFGFDQAAVTMAGAQGGLAQGRARLEPMIAQLAPGATYKGVLVIDRVNLGQIIAGSNLSHTLQMDAIVSGRIPFEAGPSGVHISGGELAAVAPGRLTIARTAFGALSTQAAVAGAKPGAIQTPVQSGFAGDLAYEALENLAFDKLDASLNSVAGDRLRILFHINGRHDPPQKVRVRLSVSDLMAGKAMRKPIPLPSDTKINLTLDTSLNFGELVRALSDAWRQQGGAQQGSAPVHDAKASMPAR